MSAREQSAICGTCGSAPGEPCRALDFPQVAPSQRPVVATHPERLRRVLLAEARRGESAAALSSRAIGGVHKLWVVRPGANA